MCCNSASLQWWALMAFFLPLKEDFPGLWSNTRMSCFTYSPKGKKKYEATSNFGFLGEFSTLHPFTVKIV
jgi:hypothetical protein